MRIKLCDLIVSFIFSAGLISGSKTLEAKQCISTIEDLARNTPRYPNGTALREHPYNGNGLILDTNATISFLKEHPDESHIRNKKLIEKALGYPTKYGRQVHFWMPKPSVGELVTPNSDLALRPAPENFRKLEILVSRNSWEYQSIKAQLKELNLGATRNSSGEIDQAIVTDVFFAKTSRNVTPTFATADKGIIGPLCNLLPDCKRARNSGQLTEHFPNGFEIHLKDATGTLRKIRILPLLN